jgi:hypothetical protein
MSWTHEILDIPRVGGDPKGYADEFKVGIVFCLLVFVPVLLILVLVGFYYG